MGVTRPLWQTTAYLLSVFEHTMPPLPVRESHSILNKQLGLHVNTTAIPAPQTSSGIFLLSFLGASAELLGHHIMFLTHFLCRNKIPLPQQFLPKSDMLT